MAGRSARAPTASTVWHHESHPRTARATVRTVQWPIVEYPNMQVMHPDTNVDATGIRTAVVGGRIYRGSALPELQGKLMFADWRAAFEKPSGQLFLATPSDR